jgi:chromate transport protein ChrA
MILPSSLLAFIAGRFVSRWQSSRWIKIAKAGLEPIALGLILASGVVMARAADHHALSVTVFKTIWFGKGRSKAVRAPAHSIHQSFAPNCFPESKETDGCGQK